MTLSQIEQYLVPRPQRLTMQRGWCARAALRHCVYDGFASEAERGYVSDELAEIVGRRLARAERAAGAGVTLRVDGAGVRGKGGESYVLAIGAEGISITGASARAVFWGLQTLRQVCEACGTRLPALRIEDWPRFAFRGFSDDMSRRQISPLRDLAFTVRWLARFKINVYQPYMEDIIYLDTHPLAGKNSGRFTRDEIAALVDAGRRHFVEIMPQYNSVSHQEHLLALPEYHALRFEGNAETLDPRQPRVRALLKDVYTQLFEQFPCTYFHMGLDEARGLVHRPDLFMEITNWLAELVVAAGRTPIMWHDMFVPYDRRAVKYSPALLQRLHPAVLLDVWLYQMPDARAAFIDEAARQGRRILLSPWIRSHYCGASRADGRAAHGLVRHAQHLPSVLGLHNTSWNDNAIVTDRALNWRGHAMAATLGWRGARAHDELAAAAQACARQMLGLRAPRDLATLDAAAAFGADAGARAGRHALTLPVRLAHAGSKAAERVAARAAAPAKALSAQLAGVQRRATRNRDLLDHVALGLARIAAGAERSARATALRTALRRGDTAAIAKHCARDAALLHRLRAQHAAVYLHRYKCEGLEYLDYYYRACIAALEDLPWQVRQQRARHAVLCAQGFVPLDLSAAATSPPRELAALLYGEVVHDNVPWRMLDPEECGGNALVWTGSAAWQEYPREISVPVCGLARELHALHGSFGPQGECPGCYRLRFADGSEERITLRAHKDCGDWWMPFGHTFGGGGALRLDPRRCRLACLTDPEHAQGHGLYHFRAPIRTRGVPLVAITIEAGHPDVSLVVAALTLRE